MVNWNYADSLDAEITDKQSFPNGGKGYTERDDWKFVSWNDKTIFISLTDDQFQKIYDYQVNGVGNPDDIKRISGCFTDEETVKTCLQQEGQLNNAMYNRLCQIYPYDDMTQHGEYSFKPYVACFKIDKTKCEDYQVLAAKCLANDIMSPGGGNQGFDSHLIDRIRNKEIVLIPEKSFYRTDRDLSKWTDIDKSNRCGGVLVESVINSKTYEDILENATNRFQDCEINNTKHSSPSVKDTNKAAGVPHVINHIPGNATSFSVIESFEKKVETFLSATPKPELSKYDESALMFMIHADINNDYSGIKNVKLEDVKEYLNNKHIKDGIISLSSAGILKSDPQEYMDRVANKYVEGKIRQNGKQKFAKELKVNGIEPNRNISKSYDKIKEKTGCEYSLKDIHGISKSEISNDKDVKQIANECRNRQMERNR